MTSGTLAPRGIEVGSCPRCPATTQPNEGKSSDLSWLPRAPRDPIADLSWVPVARPTAAVGARRFRPTEGGRQLEQNPNPAMEVDEKEGGKIGKQKKPIA